MESSDRPVSSVSHNNGAAEGETTEKSANRKRAPFSASAPNVPTTRSAKGHNETSAAVFAPAASLPLSSGIMDDHDEDDEKWASENEEDDDEEEDDWEGSNEDADDDFLDDGLNDEDGAMNHVDFADLVMKIKSCPIARALAKPFSVEAADVIIRNGFYFDPLGNNVTSLKEKPVTNRCAIYAILNESLTAVQSVEAPMAIQSVGMTSKFFRRRDYWERKGIDPERIRVLVDFDNVNETVDDALQDIYRRLLNVLSSSDELHDFQRFLVELLRERRGDRLGPKKQIVLQLIETGLQLRLKLPSTQEFLMFDRGLCNQLYDMSESPAKLIVEKMSTIRNAVASGDKLHMEGAASWKPDHDGLSSHLEAFKCILGLLYEDNINDSIPFSAIRNAKTTADVFSQKYSRVQKAGGRRRIYEIIDAFLCHTCGILFLDSNKMIFLNDTNYKPQWKSKSIIAALIHKYGFSVVLHVLSREIVLLLDPSEMHAILVHNPLCQASSSRKGQKDVVRVCRAVSLTVLTNVGRLIRGEGFLCPKDKFRNPVNAIMIFQVMHRGLHQGTRFCAAFSRDCFSGPDTYALVDNGLIKTTGEAPLATNLRSNFWESKIAAAAHVQRPFNRMLAYPALCIISNAKPGPANAKKMYDDLIRLFSSDNADPALVSARWTQFLEDYVIAGSELQKELTRQRDNSTKNKGNRRRGEGKKLPKEQIGVNDDHVRTLIEKQGPTNGETGPPFWIRENADIPKQHLSMMSGHPMFDALTFGGVENRFKAKKKKGNTKAIQADSYPHLKITKVKPNRREKGYVLVFIEERQAVPS